MSDYDYSVYRKKEDQDNSKYLLNKIIELEDQELSEVIE